MNSKKYKSYIIIFLLLLILVASFFILQFFYSRITKGRLNVNPWDGTSISTSFAGGNGTKDNPYLIDDANSFMYFKKLIEEDDSYSDKYYKLSNDINMGDKGFTPIGNDSHYFKGNFDGNGYTIGNVFINGYKGVNNKNYSGLFTRVDGDISNLNIDYIRIDNDSNVLSGVISGIYNGNLYNVTVNNLSVRGNGGLFYQFNGNINNLSVIGNLVYSIGNIVDGKITNILVNKDISNSGNNNVTNLYKLIDNKIYKDNVEIDRDSFINSFNNNYNYYFRDNNLYVSRKNNTRFFGRRLGFSLRNINVHNSGVDGKILHVNELLSDKNYYMGLNYTDKGNNTPDFSSSNKYNDSNLVKTYISYHAKSVDNRLTGGLSLDEDIDEIIYYKYYVRENGKIRIKLIDNPWAKRPNDMAFNGWVSTFPNGKITYDSETYTRYLEITTNSDTVSIDVYSSWIKATVAETSNLNDISKLKDVDMYPVSVRGKGYYNFIPGLYIKEQINSGYSGVHFPSGAVDERGNSLNGQMCRPYTGWYNSPRDCEYYQENTETIYQGNSYYKFVNGYMQRYYLGQPDGYNYDLAVENGISTASFYRKNHVNRWTSVDGYYNNRGNLLIGNCNDYSGCDIYELIQYNDEVIGNNENSLRYYYLATRDTNILVLTGYANSTNLGNKPMTITSLHNGYNFNSRINMNSPLVANSDLRIEYVTMYMNSYSGSTNSGPGSPNGGYYGYNSTTHGVYGNYNNLKIGRGINRINNYGREYFSAYGVAGGNANGSNNLRKYSLIVESGKYNALSGVSTQKSNSNYKVEASVTYGNDYDRITNNNDNLYVYYTVAGSFGGNIHSGNDSSDLFLTTTIKSGTFGDSNTTASGAYVGGLMGGTINAPSRMIVEGGKIKNLNGGPLISSNLSNSNSIYINVKGGEIDAIYGGAARTETFGNRIISVTDGVVNYSVFGGSNGVEGSGSEGTLTGDSFIYVGGNAKIGNRNDNIWGAEAGSIFGIGNGRSGYSNIGSAANSNIMIDGNATINNNIYGGGNYGAVGVSSRHNTTNTNILLKGGNVLGSVYGGGNNNGSGSTSKKSTINIKLDGGTVAGSIYGGSKTTGTIYGDVVIDAINGSSSNIYGGGEGGHLNYNNSGTYVSNNITLNIGSNNTNSLVINNNIYGGSAFGSVGGVSENANNSSYTTTVNINNGKIIGNVFGGGKGNNQFTPKEYGDVFVNINGGTIGSVFGGNDAAGSPSKDNYVKLNGGVIGNVYGGGNNTGQNITKVYMNGSNVTGDIYGGSNRSGVVNNTNIFVNSGKVNNIYGGNNLGGTASNTNIDYNGCNISGNIYGGGNRADTNVTLVNINSGKINDLFGGGNSAGVKTSNIKVYTSTVRDIYGGSNNSGSVNDTNITIKNLPVIRDIYGANNLGGSTSNTSIVVDGGTINNIYGGGNQVGVNTSSIKVNGGLINGVYGGSNNSGTASNTQVVVNNSDTTIKDLYGGNNNGGKTINANLLVNNGKINNIYGGGNKASTNKTNTKIVKGNINTVYGGGNAASVEDDTKLVIGDALISSNVYGGGNEGEVRGSTDVYLTDTKVLNSAYGGGNGSTAIVTGNTNITVDGDTIIGREGINKPDGSLFGSGNAASTGVTGSGTSKSIVNLVGGTIYGSVFGGANTSVVNGETHVNIGTHAVNKSGLKESNIKIVDTVFGGGESNASGSEIYDFNFYSVTEGINILIDGSGYDRNNHSFIFTGSIFGSGDASSSRGTSNIYIKNLGSKANPSKNVSVQRANTLTIDNSYIELSGTTDRTNEYSTYKYSFNRIDELIFKNNSVLLLRQNANLLKKFISGVDVNGKLEDAKVELDDNGNIIKKNVDNRVYLAPNEALNISTNEANTAYGEVRGMSFMGMYNPNNSGNYTYGVYGSNVKNNDHSDAANLIIGSAYVMGLHKPNHNIKVDGFYSNYLDEDDNYSTVHTRYIDPTPKDSGYYMWLIGTKTIYYEFDMVASKYSSLGTHSLSMIDFPRGDTTFNVIGFNSEGLANGVSLIDSSKVPKVTDNLEDANKILGLSMKSETREWSSHDTTKLLSSGGGKYTGSTTYKTDSQKTAPNLMFYFYHAKNINKKEDLGSVVVTLQAQVPKEDNVLEFDVKLVTIKINLYARVYNDEDAYDASIAYDKKYDLPSATSVNITNQSSFTTYYSLLMYSDSFSKLYGINNQNYHALVTNYALPVGTQITMLDYGNVVNDKPTYYYYTVTQQDYNEKVNQLNMTHEATYRLNKFIKMNSTSNNNTYNDKELNHIYYNDSKKRAMEEFMFIVDFKNTNTTGVHKNNSMLFELRNQEDRTLISVLGIKQEQMKFSTYDSSNIVLGGNTTVKDNYLYSGVSKLFSYSTVVGYNMTSSAEAIIDTNYESRAMGLNVEFIDSANNRASSSMLSGTYITINNQRYYASSDGVFRIKLAGKVSNLERGVYITTDDKLPAGSYKLKFTLFASDDGLHNGGDLTSSVKELNVVVVGNKNSIKVDIPNKEKLIYSKTGKNSNDTDKFTFNIKYTSVLTNPNIRLSVYKRNIDDINSISYTEVNPDNIFAGIINSSNNPQTLYEKNIPIYSNNYKFNQIIKKDLESGTYKLEFKLYDNNHLIDSDNIYIIVKKDLKD